MIETIVRFSVRQRGFMILMGLALLAFGLYSATQLPIDAVPDITTRQVQINSTVTAMGPEEVERRVTFPLEQALTGIPRLKETRSVSQFGLSQVTVVFDDDIDLYFARQLVNERIQGAKELLPPDATVEMAPVSTGLGEIYYLQVEGGKYSTMERRSMVDWIVKPQLRSVQGLAEVNTFGGQVMQYQVLVDPQKLAGYDLTIRDVVTAVSANNANAGGSYIQRGAEQQIVRTVGTLERPEDIARVVVGVHDGVPVLVGQVATVGEGAAARQGAFTENGKGEQVAAISLLLVGENGRIVIERIKDRVATIQKALPKDTKLVGFFDRSELIDRTLHTAVGNLAEGGLLVIAVLFLFLLQLRAGLIVSSVIPLSMLAAVIGMRQFGVSANLMSLGAIDFGLIVDGAVIIVENVVRHLAERRRELRRDLTEDERLETILHGTIEVRRASQFGELIIVAAYLPILSLVGVEGKMFRPMGLTVIMALVGALVLSFTLVPALCAQFLRVREERSNRLLAWLSPRYERSLGSAIQARWMTAGVAALFVAVSLSLFGRLGSEFLPELDEGAIAMGGAYPPGMSLEKAVEQSTLKEKVLRDAFPSEIKRIVTRIGRPEIASDPMLPSQFDTLIDLHPRTQWREAVSREDLQTKMSEVMEHVPGVGVSFSQPIKLRMNELIEGIGIRSDLAVKLFGDDMGLLAEQGAKIQRIVSSVRGAADVSLETTEGQPQVQIRIDRDRISRYGINVSDVNEVVEAALGGRAVSQMSDGNRRVDIAVKLPERYRSSPQSIGALMIPSPTGARVPLTEIADVVTREGPVQISREEGRRRVVIQANVRGRDLGGFVEEVKRRVDRDLALPTGYYVDYGGTYDQLQSGRARLEIVVPVTFGLIFLLLFSTFGSSRQALLVFTGIPFAATGGVLALLLRGMPFSISAGVGFIALAGIAVLNGVVMVTFINGLRKEGLGLLEATQRGALQRLRPVLMTACVAGFGFVPMAIAHGSGAEVQRPLATVVIGGLITSTILTLFVLPTLYTWFEKERPAEVVESEAAHTGNSLTP